MMGAKWFSRERSTESQHSHCIVKQYTLYKQPAALTPTAPILVDRVDIQNEAGGEMFVTAISHLPAPAIFVRRRPCLVAEGYHEGSKRR